MILLQIQRRQLTYVTVTVQLTYLRTISGIKSKIHQFQWPGIK